MSFESHIYDRQEIKESNSNWPLTIVLLLALIFGYLLTDISRTLGAVIIIVGIIGIYFHFYKDWIEEEEEGKYIGEIILTADQFTLHKDVVRTSEIEDLKIEIRNIRGHKHNKHFGYIVDSGTHSSIEFTLKGEKRHYNFQILSVGHLKELKNVLEELYKRNIFVNEFYLGSRTYLLRKLNYAGIQEFKKKYDLV